MQYFLELIKYSLQYAEKLRLICHNSKLTPR